VDPGAVRQVPVALCRRHRSPDRHRQVPPA
jgi:hypothetical protein